MFDGIPIGLLYLNFIGMVLLFLTVVMGVTFIVRGARGYGGRGGPWDCGRGDSAGWRGHGPSHFRGGYGHPDRRGGAGKRGRHGSHGRQHGGRQHGGGHHGGHHRGGKALGIARLRLASGEISVDEYTALRAALDA
jgi:hypothetical protein